MTQLTFTGMNEGNEPTAVPTVSDAPESWYKGRVLSHSSMGMYRGCPQRWKFRYIDKVPERPRSFFSFGKSLHTGLEFLFERLSEPLPALEDVLTHFKTNWLREGYETAAQEKWFFQEGERILRGFYAKHQNDRRSVFQIEYKFSITIEGVPITGYIDRIDATPSGGLAILDYKTGKAIDKARVRSDSQLTLYQIACQEVFQKPVESVTLYHLNSLTPLTVPAHSKKMEDDLRAAIVETAKGISEGKFDPKPDEKGACQWCDYLQICPAFAGRKVSISVGGAASALAAKADRLGKLDLKIMELRQERDDLQTDLSTAMQSAGSEEIRGAHFVVKKAELADETRLTSSPIDGGASA